MAAISHVHAPIRALSNLYLPETETAAYRIHVKEEGKGEERESVVEFPLDAPGSSHDNAFWIPSDDDDDDDDDSEFLGSKALGASREPGLPVTPGVFGSPEANPGDTSLSSEPHLSSYALPPSLLSDLDDATVKRPCSAQATKPFGHAISIPQID